MKITLVTPSLFCGGAERVVVSLAEGFSLKGHQVTVISFANKDTDFYQLPQGVARIALGIMGESKNPLDAILNNFSRLSIIRRAVVATQPDVVISHLTSTNVLTTLALIGTKYPVLVTEHCDPNLMSYGKFWETLRCIVYPLADKLVSVSQGVENYFTWLPKAKKVVVYNPFLVTKSGDEPQLPSGVNPDRKWIISMGRLTHQKGFDLLLTAFATLAPQYPDWQLIILGEGELRSELEKQIEELNLAGAVVLPGRVNPPFPLIKRAEFFVMSSRFEGFPMAHGEAMLCGVPVIATDCPSGPSELIRHNIDGILIPNQDVEALKAAMEKLMSDPAERKRLAAAAPEVGTRFGLEKIVQDWENVIKNCQDT
jgi:glycosyltransferase involved in cell wall biosynthesis